MKRLWRCFLLLSCAITLAVPVSAQMEQAEEVSEVVLYRVASGDTLWRIAFRVFHDASLWPALYLANRDQIKDPARVYPGQELLVPKVAPEERIRLRREAEALLQ